MAYGYKQKEFNKDELFRQKYGTHASWGDKLAFNKYWNSEQREADELAHINSEIAKSNEYWDGVVKQAINRTRGIPEPVKKPEAPSLYKQQDFEQTKMAEMFGTNPSEWDKKRFQTYLKSDQGQKDWLAFDQAEHQKYMDSMDAVTNHAIQRTRQAAVDFKASMKPALVPKPEVVVSPQPAQPAQPAQPVQPVQSKPAITPRSDAEWNRIAKENGFTDMAEVKAWQAANGLVDDGKFGNNSSAYFKQNGMGKYTRPGAATEQPAATQTPAPTPAPAPAPSFDLDAFRKTQGLKSDAFVTHNGQKYLRYDPDDVGDFYIGEDGSMYRANWGGGVGDAIDRQKHLRYSTPNGTRWERNYNDVYNKVDAFKKATMNKQGGTMRINYFQQGGAAPQQQDIKAQVVALVQAAMQGDQKATQTVNQIMEAAKAGDQQAMQIAQLMEQVIKQMQGQATAAKYGAKLNYLQSLKCGGKAKKKEQGGKVCPACEQAKQTKKSLVSKHQQGSAINYNKAINYYRGWSEDEIRKLKIGLAGYAGYEGDVSSGKADREMVEAVARLQNDKKVTGDGMWGTNSNTAFHLVDWETANRNKGANWKPEQGDHVTYEVSGKKMKENDYYKAVNDLKKQFYADPEAFWNTGGDTAKWREHLYTTPEGTAIMEEFYSATPDDVRKKLGSRVTNRKMQQDQMDSGIREANGKVADIAVKKVLPAMAGIAAAPAIVMNPLAGLAGVGGAYVGGAAGRQVGENLSDGDTSAWTSVDGMGNVASVATPTSEIVAPVTEALGTAIGGYGGWKFGQNAGKPSLDGLWRGPELRVHGKNGPLAPVSQYVYHPRPNYKPHANPNKGKVFKKGNNTKNSKEPYIDFENLSQRKANGGSIERIKYFSLV